jgi:hypothetical protein
VANCVCVNPDIDAYWAIDFRLNDPQGNGKTKPAQGQPIVTNLGLLVLRHSLGKEKQVITHITYLQRMPLELPFLLSTR